MIELPEKFKRDIEGNDTYLIPLVVIDDRIYLSTNKVSLAQQHYDPLIKSISNIKESIDIDNKIFKISYFKLSLINYEYNDNRISDTIFIKSDSYSSNILTGLSIMNKKIDMYYKSQSAESLDDCLKVYSGYVRGINETSELVTIESEDSTEYNMNKTIPDSTISYDSHVPDRYWGQVVPIVYGHVSKAPCVFFDSLTEEDPESPYMGSETYKIMPDSKHILETSKPMIYDNGAYGEIKENADMFSENKAGTVYEDVITDDQYKIFDNKIFIQKYPETVIGEDIGLLDYYGPDMEHPTLTQLGFVEVSSTSNVTFTHGNYILITKPSETIGTEAGVQTYDGEPNPYFTSPRLIQRTKIFAYEDEAGNIPAQNKRIGDAPLYLMIKDYRDLLIPDKWLQGENEFLGVEYPYINRADYGGEAPVRSYSYLYFETDKWFSLSSLLNELPAEEDDGEPVKIYPKVFLEHNFEARINELEYNISYNRYPKFLFKMGSTDHRQEIWDMKDNNPYQDYEYGTVPDINPYTLHSSLSNDYPITDAHTVYEPLPSFTRLVLSCAGGYEVAHELKWLKFFDMKAIRQGVVSDFLSLEIYAEVYGRVDNVLGRYTGEEQITLSAQSDFDARRETAMQAPQISRAKKSRGKKPRGKKSIRSGGGGY
tara:strand:- start:4044 stop:6005 length:1962 start_codon:yes stop_codon:yes gene_type:complete